MIDDLLFGKALGACGADVVRVEHLEHVRAGVAHERTRADDDQRDNGQHEMVRLIHDLTPAAELVVVAADQTEQIEPAELDGKDQLQKRSEEEGRQRDTGQRDNRDRVVGSAVLLGCGDDAEGNRDEDLKDEGDAAHHEGEPDAVVELFKHRHGVEPAVAEITADGGTEPGKITGNDALIHVVHGIELRHPIVEALRARLHGLLARHILNEGSRQAAHQRIDNESHKEEDHDGNQNSFYYVFSQANYLRSDVLLSVTLSLTFLLHIKQRSSEKRSAPCRAVGAARRPVKTAGLLD